MVIIETIRCIPISTLELPDELWDIFGECADFTWGDNNRTLVFPYRIADHIQKIDLDGQWSEVAYRFTCLENEYPGVLIDLEN